MIRNALDGWMDPELELLFIENVGNLVCPSSYDLGENLRLVLMSVTEGEDKPLKYPTIYNTADVAIITKTDLAAAVEFDSAAAHWNIQAVRPGMEILDVSVKSSEGMERWIQLLESHIAESRAGALGQFWRVTNESRTSWPESQTQNHPHVRASCWSQRTGLVHGLGDVSSLRAPACHGIAGVHFWSSPRP